MGLPLVLAAFSFTIIANAQNLSSYVPECAPPCVEQTLNSTKLCDGLDDNKCLCTNASQIIFPSRMCFIQNCNSTNPIELRSEVVSGWEKFCNDSGTPINLSAGWNPGSIPSSTSSVTPSMIPTSSPAPSTESDTSSGLSTGAKAGVGVGAGVGVAVIGGLVFLVLRGRQKKGSEDAAGSTLPLNEEIHPYPYDTSVAWATAEGGGGVWAYKPQSALAELSSQHPPNVELPAHNVTELPVNHPAELWHGVMPPELSADGEIRQIRSTERS
ncbi:hypothetical protein GQX73_g826 [Xylaria multiplex]|uniref:CFEM domain-containing protein n=1 Tax=Xylaria multiplex TaxID=323545 RepID=A0A7C8IUQ7_9PEZI|nr:hypothetical protein GQX73_g826 [Xylaria multiplex]